MKAGHMTLTVMFSVLRNGGPILRASATQALFATLYCGLIGEALRTWSKHCISKTRMKTHLLKSSD